MKKGLYYLQLQVNVFDSDEFKLIKSQEDGNMLQYLYLRLLTKSLPTNGRLVFNDTRAFTPTSISKIFDLPLKLVETGWSVFQELGLLVEIEKDINDLPIMGLYSFKEYIGTLTPDAERKRIQRQKEDKKVLMDAKAKRKPIKSTFIDIESIPDACPKLSQICPEMTSELEIDTEQQKYQKVESNIELNSVTEK